MTPDEAALLRAVVTDPGDGLARPVYADWLDDRGDPRGAYLRAEMSAAGDAVALAPIAAGLDAVWVARVSRPPVGVCSDRVRFTNPGRPLDSADLDAAQHRLGGVLPPDYRAFLLNTNGGTPDPPCLDHPDADPMFDLEIDEFFRVNEVDAVGGSHGSAHEYYRDHLNALYSVDWQTVEQNPLLIGLIPIANTSHDLGYFLIGIADDNRGRVLHFAEYCHNVDDPSQLRESAPSFAEFLSRLRPDNHT